MLTDPLPIKTVTLSAHSAVTVGATHSFARVDAGDGSARYVDATALLSGIVVLNGPSVLRTAHSVSNENKPTKTNRTLIRLDIPLLGLGREMLGAYCYSVIGIPATNMLDPTDGETIVTPATIGVALTNFLVGALACSSTAATLDETKIARILAGES
jgi:hypothetical protein